MRTLMYRIDNFGINLTSWFKYLELIQNWKNTHHSNSLLAIFRPCDSELNGGNSSHAMYYEIVIK